MAVNFSEALYLQTQVTFSRSVTITPLASQPGQPAYTTRGIFDTRQLDVPGADGSIYSDTITILDIRDAEFPIMPIQLDRVTIPSDSGLPAEGTFEITDTDPNGGGETTLTLRRIVSAAP